jgi:hypothetical protein
VANMSVQVSVWVSAFNSYRMELLAPMVILCLTLEELWVRPYAFDPLVDISEIGRSAKSYCEHTARTQPTLSDIVVTLVEMGKYTSNF